MKLGHSVYLSERVYELLEEGTLAEVFKIVEDELKGSWAATPPGDSVARESVYHQLHALSLLRMRLESLVTEIRFPSLGDNQ